MKFNVNVNVRHHNEDILKFFTANFEANRSLVTDVIESILFMYWIFKESLSRWRTVTGLLANYIVNWTLICLFYHTSQTPTEAWRRLIISLPPGGLECRQRSYYCTVKRTIHFPYCTRILVIHHLHARSCVCCNLHQIHHITDLRTQFDSTLIWFDSQILF